MPAVWQGPPYGGQWQGGGLEEVRVWLAATSGFLLAWGIKAAPPQPWLRLALVRTAMAKADEGRSSKPIDPSSRLPIIEALAGKLVLAHKEPLGQRTVTSGRWLNGLGVERIDRQLAAAAVSAGLLPGQGGHP